MIINLNMSSSDYIFEMKGFEKHESERGFKSLYLLLVGQVSSLMCSATIGETDMCIV